jgi:etoposide-induced 2.4 mRNA
MPYYRQAKLSFKETTKLCAQYFWCGIKDAFAWPSSLITIYGSKTILNRTRNCLILNGFIFLGSIFFFNHITIPTLHFFLGKTFFISSYQRNDNNDVVYSPFLTNILETIVALTYRLFWVYPIFLLSFVLNAVWYQEIADRVYRLQFGQPVNSPLLIADEIYRAILFMNYLIFATIIYVLPIVGPIISFTYFCWIYAYYSFEYKWINQGWKLEKRIEYFEEKWAYFAGFGFTFTAITFFVDHFLSAGVFALFFPLVSKLYFSLLFIHLFSTISNNLYMRLVHNYG